MNRTTATFGATAVTLLLLLTLAVVAVTYQTVRGQSRHLAMSTAQDVVGIVTSTLTADDVNAPTVARRLDGVGDRVISVQVWDLAGDPVLRVGDDDAVDLTRLRSTIETEAASTVARDADGIPVLAVYVPVQEHQLGGGAQSHQVVAVAQVLLDESGSRGSIAAAMSRIVPVMVVGAVAVWVVLLRSVRSMQGRLQAVAQENARLAHLDSLTGLPNRRLFSDRIQEAVEEAARSGSRVGMIVLDLDRFKEINDSLGHDSGDELLQLAATRLRNALRADDTVARMGGDEFAVLLPGITSVDDAVRLARRLRAQFDRPFDLDDLALRVDSSVGVACLPDHAADASGLMRMADVAMYRAKTSRTGVALYSACTDQPSTERLRLAGDLRQALRSREPGELVLHYQPKIDLSTNAVVGLEALIRWHHPEHGLLEPASFVMLAEQSGLIHDLTRFSLGEAVSQLATWQVAGSAVPVSVNLSSHDLADDRLVDVIRDLLAHYEVSPELLMVEVAEAAVAVEPAHARPLLHRLVGLGVKVALDGFGVGSTSVSQLRTLPVAQLKIDRLLIRGLCEPEREQPEVLVSAMTDLAHTFGFEVVAEGVEDETTADLVARLGADQAQGTFYAEPQPPDLVAIQPV